MVLGDALWRKVNCGAVVSEPLVLIERSQGALPGPALQPHQLLAALMVAPAL